LEFWEDYEVLTVETPEHLELRLPLAGFGPRFLAALVDSIVVTVGLTVLILVYVAVTAAFGTSGMGALVGNSVGVAIVILASLVLLLSPLAYYVVFEALWNGQTPGKRLTGIRVVMRGGVPLTFRGVMYRNLLRLIDMLPSHYFTGIVSFFASKFQQRLGDLVADTVVIREFRTRQPYLWAGTVPSGMSLAPGTLTPQLTYVISSYMTRRHKLTPESRELITRKSIAQLGYNPLGLSLEQRDNYLISVLQGAAGAAAH
jgi:uncharacterized RDD family membrane protein YckC